MDETWSQEKKDDDYDSTSEDQASYRVCKKDHHQQPYSVCYAYEHVTTYKRT
jgi:hypothetical protein